jgi:hypothetical protein
LGTFLDRLPWNKKENVMLRNFATALVATALIAGPALAQTSGSTSGSAPVTAPAKQTAPVNAAPANTASAPAASNAQQSAKPGKTVKHAKIHKKTVRHSTGRSGKSSKMHQARHIKSTKTHQVNTGRAAKRS